MSLGEVTGKLRTKRWIRTKHSKDELAQRIAGTKRSVASEHGTPQPRMAVTKTGGEFLRQRKAFKQVFDMIRFTV